MHGLDCSLGFIVWAIICIPSDLTLILAHTLQRDNDHCYPTGIKIFSWLQQFLVDTLKLCFDTICIGLFNFIYIGGLTGIVCPILV